MPFKVPEYIANAREDVAWRGLTVGEVAAMGAVLPGDVISEVGAVENFNIIEGTICNQIAGQQVDVLEQTAIRERIGSLMRPSRGTLNNCMAIVLPPDLQRNPNIRKRIAAEELSPEAVVTLCFTGERFFSGRPTGDVLWREATYWRRVEGPGIGLDIVGRALGTAASLKRAEAEIQAVNKEASNRSFAIASVGLKRFLASRPD